MLEFDQADVTPRESASAVDANEDADLRKEPILSNITDRKASAFRRYQDFFVGQRGVWALIKYELVVLIGAPMPGALGYWLRKRLFGVITRNHCKGVLWGRNVVLRHPANIEIGAGTVIDDGCAFDARGAGAGAFQIGQNVLIARGCIVRSKTNQGSVTIGNGCSIGADTIISSTGGVSIGNDVGIAGQCYIGGGRYKMDQEGVPIIRHELYTNGPVEIGDGCSIGVGAKILDGVKIGPGSMIGAGVIVRESIPGSTVVTPHQRLVMTKRQCDS